MFHEQLNAAASLFLPQVHAKEIRTEQIRSDQRSEIRKEQVCLTCACIVDRILQANVLSCISMAANVCKSQMHQIWSVITLCANSSASITPGSKHTWCITLIKPQLSSACNNAVVHLNNSCLLLKSDGN